MSTGVKNINNKRIAKNTMMLYIRMLAIMLVSLYSSRVILDQLGVEDYGIYNLVAGFITLFSFVSNALVAAVQRFFNVVLGKGDYVKYSNYYTASIDIIFVFGFIIILLGETIGLWFVESKINIPANRVDAAIIVYHLSLLTFLLNLLRTSLSASIIANEKMSFYSWTGIADAVLRLIVVLILSKVEYDKMVIYALLYVFVIALLTLIYWLYCRIKLKGCVYSHSNISRNVYKELLSFSTWTLLGQSSVLLRTQGEAYCVNHFFSVVANAAIGISNQVTSAVDAFVVNFQTAFNPQIIKSYSSGSKSEHFNLVFRASRFSYYLLFIISLPLLFNIDKILELWLKEVPEYSNIFCIIVLASHLINVIGAPLYTSVLATGKIKRYQILLFITFVSGLILSFWGLYLGQKPYFIAIVSCIIQLFLLSYRIYFCNNLTGLNVEKFFKEVILPILIVTLISLLMSILISVCVDFFIFRCLLEIITILIVILFIGMKNNERKSIYSIIFSKFRN